MPAVTVHHGDCREVMARLPAASVDAVVTDPPYHLASIVQRFGSAGAAPARGSGAMQRASRGFMGQRWDGGAIAMEPATWRAVLRVLKPGGYMIVSCGTKTEHRVACAIEDAGFEIRDRLLWLYGSGFPKSHKIAKAIDKVAGVDGERVPTGGPVRRMRPGADQVQSETWDKLEDRDYEPHAYEPATADARHWDGWGTALKPAVEIGVLAQKPFKGSVAANVLRHGVGGLNIDACRVATDETIACTRNVALGSSSGGIYGAAGKPGAYQRPDGGRWPANVAHDGSNEVLEAFARYGDRGAAAPVKGTEPSSPFANVYGDMPGRSGASEIHDAPGSAARFFFCGKATADDRLGSKHPTVKPVALVRWWVRLIVPPGGTVLDPFAGTGTTGQAALAEGCSAILIEREAAYVADIERRLAHVRGADTPLFGGDGDG